MPIIQNAATATGAGSVFSVAGLATVAFDVRITGTATVTFQGSVNGTDWTGLLVSPFGASSTALTAASSGIYQANIAGLREVRANITAYTNGTVTVDVQGTQAGGGAGAGGSSGGGSQYTEGDVDSSITGTAVMWEDAANTLATVNASKPMPVQQAALDYSIDNVAAVGFLTNPSANFTRPGDTTAYASGDLVANSTTAGSVTPLSWTAGRVAAGSFLVRRVRLRKTNTGVTNASFRLHLYSASPTVTNGDNGAWLSNSVANYLGALDVSIDKAFSDGAAGTGVPLAGGEINVALASGQTIYGLLEARGAYTPGNAEVITAVLELYQN